MLSCQRAHYAPCCHGLWKLEINNQKLKRHFTLRIRYGALRVSRKGAKPCLRQGTQRKCKEQFSVITKENPSPIFFCAFARSLRLCVQLFNARLRETFQSALA
jgi:hypothetical protein